MGFKLKVWYYLCRFGEHYPGVRVTLREFKLRVTYYSVLGLEAFRAWQFWTKKIRSGTTKPSNVGS